LVLLQFGQAAGGYLNCLICFHTVSHMSLREHIGQSISQGDMRKSCSAYGAGDQRNICESLINTNYSSIISLRRNHTDPWAICLSLHYCQKPGWTKRLKSWFTSPLPNVTLPIGWYGELKEWWQTTWNTVRGQVRDAREKHPERRSPPPTKSPKNTPDLEI
jgi:hypothetical protein